jgi:hypothetical protein
LHSAESGIYHRACPERPDNFPAPWSEILVAALRQTLHGIITLRLISARVMTPRELMATQR